MLRLESRMRGEIAGYCRRGRNEGGGATIGGHVVGKILQDSENGFGGS